MGIKKLELLSPAKNHAFGMAAVSHGADAVYIGADRFSARAAAGNPVAEIEKLAAYAHLYNAKVYVAMNTLIFDHELEDAQDLIHQLWDAGADALIIQDMGIFELSLPPIPLFASTQLDSRTVSRVRFLEAAGFERVILARELSLKEIEQIRQNTTVDLEAFVHGALCAGYSGQCYFSAAIGGRSANRGECGQPCRLAWTLMSEKGQVLEKDRYLLSLKDMNRSDYLGHLASAGITSFKIEGRLKDLAYVKNITAYYRKKLDALIAGKPDYQKASSGKIEVSFTPDPVKTFNRGETDYFLFGRKGEIHSFATPKSIGEKIGVAQDIESRYFTLKNRHDLQNGDGICYVDKSGTLQGFLVNRTDQEKIYPSGRVDLKKSPLAPGLVIYRNHNHNFLKKLANPSAQRRIAVDATFCETPEGFCLQGVDEDGNRADVSIEIEKITAQNESAALSTMKKQLSRMGDSLFYLKTLTVRSKPYFMATKDLNHIRRKLVDSLAAERAETYRRLSGTPRSETASGSPTRLDFTANVSNSKAKAFYQKQGVTAIDPAFELAQPGPGTVVMTLRHCIRKALGHCSKETKACQAVWKEPLFIENKTARFQIEFDCVNCEMKIIKP